MPLRDIGHGVRTGMAGSRFQVHAPYTPEFIVEAHRLQGRYRSRSVMWSFPRHQYPKVAEALNRIFGTQLQYSTPAEGAPE